MSCTPPPSTTNPDSSRTAPTPWIARALFRKMAPAQFGIVGQLQTAHGAARVATRAQWRLVAKGLVLVALVDEVLIERCDLDNLTALFALAKQRAVLEVMDI